jgi:hypothetical protein
MINTALLIIALSGNLVYELEMPNMKECVKASTQIEEQDSYFNSICVPLTENSIVILKCDDEESDWKWRERFRD